MFELISAVVRRRTILSQAIATALVLVTVDPSLAAPHDLDGDGRSDISVARTLVAPDPCKAVNAAPWSDCRSDVFFSHIAWFSSYSLSGASEIRSIVVSRRDGSNGYVLDPTTAGGSQNEILLIKLNAYESFAPGDVFNLASGDSFTSVFSQTEASNSSRIDVESWLTSEDLSALSQADVYYTQALMGFFANLDGLGKRYLSLWQIEEGVVFVPHKSLTRPVTLEALLFPHGVPVVADYDGDGRDELAVWEYGTAEWIIRDYGSLSEQRIQWGLFGDHPMPGDYDGDGKADLAVWRPSNGYWYILTSRSGYSKSQAQVHQFGLPHQGTTFDVLGDIPVKGDYDGDGRLDLAVFRPHQGSWYYRRSSDGQVITVRWGLPGDLPVGMGYLDRLLRLPAWSN